MPDKPKPPRPRCQQISGREIRPGDVVWPADRRARTDRIVVTKLSQPLHLTLAGLTVTVGDAVIPVPAVELVSVVDTLGRRHTFRADTDLRREERPDRPQAAVADRPAQDMPPASPDAGA